ncbi:hypothetical protein J3998_11115 [Thiomicrorhabdus sp. 6S2-11]|uniref:Replication initiation factor n=1 Tax=Thiomicrorhabdus marina TaxID=2818442 RepID=A0ABS3Q707_9GAMM|nr:hypothetical protein [Thiomicrorhabdus marina]MBO1928125.1 hypothetical protein [Thiomicrorhabdus marina]
MSNSNTKPEVEARESVGLQERAGSARPQATSRTCNHSGAALSNTAPAKYINNQNIKPLRCAVDSLYLSYRGNITPQIEELLTFLKNMAQHTDPEIASEAYLHFFEHKFQVMPKGAGKFSFVLKDNWFNIQVSSGKSSSVPLAYVQISSELLTFMELDEILKHLDQIIDRLGTVKGHPSVSRLDLCMDFECYSKFNVEAIEINQWKTRAKQIDRFHQNKRPSGWRIGKGLIMGRLYNKSLEIQKSKKDYLLPLWEASGWSGVTDVWRVEFQMRREFLANVGLKHPDKITKLSPAVWKYASTNWLQLVTPTDDSNESRWPVTEAWHEIAQACTNVNCQAVKPVVKRRLPNDQYLFVNGLAAISSFMAREGISDLGEALGEFLHEAERYHLSKDQTMEDYLKMKAKEKTLRYNTELKE